MGAITIKDETQYLEDRIDTKQKNIIANKKSACSIQAWECTAGWKENTILVSLYLPLFSLLKTKAEDTQKPTIA